MTEWHTVGLTLLSAAIAGLVWLIRLEQRVNYLDKHLENHLAEKAKLMDQITSHFERLEGKVDRIALRCAAFHASTGFIPPRLDENGGDDT